MICTSEAGERCQTVEFLQGAKSVFDFCLCDMENVECVYVLYRHTSF